MSTTKLKVAVLYDTWEEGGAEVPALPPVEEEKPRRRGKKRARRKRTGEHALGIDGEAHAGKLAHERRAGAARGVGDEAAGKSAPGRGLERLSGAGDERAVLEDGPLQIDQKRLDPRKRRGHLGFSGSAMRS